MIFYKLGYYIFIELLKLAQVIDNDLNWVGNDTFVIQLGDTLDGKRPDTILEKSYVNLTGEIEITNLILSLGFINSNCDV